MDLFRVNSASALPIPFDRTRYKEDFIHGTIEANLGVFFPGFKLVKSKAQVGGREFDTLAFDSVSNKVVIIEYKRDDDRRVTDQVSIYSAKLQHNKDRIRLLFSQAGIPFQEIDFDNPKILVIAKIFTDDQKEMAGAARNRDYLYLWRFELYDEGLLGLEEIAHVRGHQKLSPRAAGRSSKPEGGWPLDHFGMTADVRGIYDELSKKIKELDPRIGPERTNKLYVGFGAPSPNFCRLKPKKKFLRVEVKLRGPAPKVPGLKLQKRGNSDMPCQFELWSRDAIDSAIIVIRQGFQESVQGT